MRSSIFAVLFALGASACSGGFRAQPATPRDPGKPNVPLPPWQARSSVADGYEPERDAPAPVLVKNATLLLGNGRRIARGSLVLEKGKIAALAEGDLPAPVGATVVDAAGKFVTPGLIDVHSHLGVYPTLAMRGDEDGNEASEPVTAFAQTADAFWPQDPGIERAVAGGVTTIQVLPGSANSIGGRSIVVKLRPGQSAREMHFKGALDGLKMACGENPTRVYGREQHRAPITRMGNVAGQRAAFLKAKKLIEQWQRWREGEEKRLREDGKKHAAYEAKWIERTQREAWCKKNDEADPCADWRKQWAREPLDEPTPSERDSPPDRDPGSETLAAAIEGRVLVHVHCYRADDMLSMLSLADEIGFKVRSFHHALEAYKIRGELAKRGVGVSTWADWWGFKLEAYDGIPENLALFHESGGHAIVHSDSDEGIQRLNQEAAKGLASGLAAGVKLSPDEAIAWVTSNPAWALGVDARVGTLEPGKDADVVLWDKDPLSVYASAEMVWIDGALVRDKNKAHWSDFELGQPSQSEAP